MSPWTGCCYLAGAVAFVCALSVVSPDVEYAIRDLFGSDTTESALDAALENDPVHGAKLPVALEFESDTWLIFAGQCRTCSLKSILPVVQMLKQAKCKIVTVFSGPIESGICQAMKAAGADEILGDEGATLHHAANAVFTPRVYLVGKGGVLRYVQKTPAASELLGVIKAVKESL